MSPIVKDHPPLLRAAALLVLACCTWLAAGCTAIPLGSVPRLTRLQGPDVSVADLEVAIRVEDAIRVRPGTAKVTMQIFNAATGAERAEEFVLKPIDAPLTPGLKNKIKPGFLIHRFRLSQEDRARVDLFKRDMLALKTAGTGKNRVTLGASAGFCRPVGATPTDRAHMTFYFRTHPGEDYITLVKEQTLSFRSPTAPGAGLSVCL